MKAALKMVSRVAAGVVLIPLIAVAVPLMVVFHATTWLAFRMGDWALLGEWEET